MAQQKNSAEMPRCIAFSGNRSLGAGQLLEVAQIVKTIVASDEQTSILIFDSTTSDIIEVDFRGSMRDVEERILRLYGVSTDEQLSSHADRLPNQADRVSSDIDQVLDTTVPATTLSLPDADVDVARKPGRPKLGVVSREVTLLPRHWEWLSTQSGGASVALRKLVETARHESAEKDRVRIAQERTYRFMSAIAGNLAGFEEATRALFAQNQKQFLALINEWPEDVKAHIKEISRSAF